MNDSPKRPFQAFLLKLADAAPAEISARIEADQPDYYDCPSCYGMGCIACGNRGRIESDQHREAREDHEDRKADAIRKGEW